MSRSEPQPQCSEPTLGGGTGDKQEHGKLRAPVSSPTSQPQEWTVESVWRDFGSGGVLKIRKLASAHNAALAAEREKVEQQMEFRQGQQERHEREIKLLVDALNDMRGYDHGRVDRALAKVKEGKQ